MKSDKPKHNVIKPFIATGHDSVREELLAAIEQGDLAMLVASPPIAFQRVFVDVTGSATAALLLSACMQDFEFRSATKDGWYSVSAEEWQRLTGLTRKEQSSARKTLRELSLLRERLQGFPAQLEVQVNFDEISRRLIDITKRKPLPSPGLTPGRGQDVPQLH